MKRSKDIMTKPEKIADYECETGEGPLWLLKRGKHAGDKGGKSQKLGGSRGFTLQNGTHLQNRKNDLWNGQLARLQPEVLS